MMITTTSIFLVTHIIFSLNIVASKAASAYIERADTIDRNDFPSGNGGYRFGTVFHLTPDASHIVGGTLGWREGATRGGGDVRVYKKFPGGGDGSGDDYYAQIGGDVKYEERNEGYWDGAVEFDVNEAKISDDGNVLAVAYDYFDSTTAYNGQATTVFHRVIVYNYNADEYKYVPSQTIEWEAAYPSSVTMDMNGRGDRIVLGDRYSYMENQRDGLVRIFVRQSSSNDWVLSCNIEGADQEYQGYIGGQVKMNSEGDVVAFLISRGGSGSSKVEVHSLDRDTGACGPEIGSGVTLRYRGIDWDGAVFDIDAEGSTIIVGDSDGDAYSNTGAVQVWYLKPENRNWYQLGSTLTKSKLRQTYSELETNLLGADVAISGDGKYILVGDLKNRFIFLYRLNLDDNDWTLVAKDSRDEDDGAYSSLSLSHDGSTWAAGARDVNAIDVYHTYEPQVNEEGEEEKEEANSDPGLSTDDGFEAAEAPILPEIQSLSCDSSDSLWRFLIFVEIVLIMVCGHCL
mmetsp:Transcript_29641/g.57464  ORF Transcript_29641/g.57464 Transcript_29641/m.57464 type:complete len:514 (-) Transcript_29641:463-2004(-)